MREIHSTKSPAYLSILVAPVGAFVASSVYYMIFDKALASSLPADSVSTDMSRVPAWEKAAEFVHGLILAFVVG